MSMRKDINYKSLPPEFLLEKFPSPDRYHELAKYPPESSLAVSGERYVTVRDKINKAFQGSSVRLSDKHWAIIIKNLEGYLVLSRSLEPNKQL